MKAIIKIHTFDMNQEVFIEDRSSATGFTAYPMTLNEIPDFIISNKNVTEIHIFGNEHFLKNTIQKIRDKEYIKYNQNNISIFINK